MACILSVYLAGDAATSGTTSQKTSSEKLATSSLTSQYTSVTSQYTSGNNCIIQSYSCLQMQMSNKFINSQFMTLLKQLFIHDRLSKFSLPSPLVDADTLFFSHELSAGQFPIIFSLISEWKFFIFCLYFHIFYTVMHYCH